MGQDARGSAARGQQGGAQRTETAIRVELLGGDPVRLGLERWEGFLGAASAQGVEADAEAVERSPQVDRGGAGVQQRRREIREKGGGRLPGTVPGEPDHHRVGGGDPDGGGPANRHRADGVRDLGRFRALDPDFVEREPALVEEVEDLAAGVPAEGADHGGHPTSQPGGS